MYKIKPELAERLKDGRSNAYLSEATSRGLTMISLVFNGAKCSEILAKALISIRERIPMNDDKMKELLEYYFEII